MNDDSSPGVRIERASIFVSVLTALLTLVGLGFVFGPLLGLGWLEKPPENVDFYITEVGVPLLTFAGFLAVFLGFLSQRRQNQLQEEQLRKQQKNFQKDRFESTFFHLLRTHNQIVNDIQYEESRPENWAPHAGDEDLERNRMNGRLSFEKFYSEFKNRVETPDDEMGVGVEDVRDFYREEWFDDYKPQLNHYFNNFSKIISFVERSKVENKQFYIDLIIAQMSIPELVLFFYHAAAMRDSKGYVHGVYKLLGKYTFFEQINPERSLIHREHDELHPEALGIRR